MNFRPDNDLGVVAARHKTHTSTVSLLVELTKSAHSNKA
jgi:hypothetical protein